MPASDSAPAPRRARRLDGNPILHRDTTPGVGRNINGPSLITAPPWLEQPLGRYYLYFAHHRGTFIRLATADRLDGPWSVYQPGTLRLAQSRFPTEGRRPHIASPDVHVDTATRTVRMYYHGLDTVTRVQHTRVATSADGIHFEARPELLGRPYFRVFAHDGWWYALARAGILYRSADGMGGFERGPRLLDRDARHTALLVRGDELLVFWSRVGDTPERILCSRVPLGGDWRTWRAGPATDVLAPERPWEGAGQPLEASERGWVDEPVRQLRDPAVFCEDDRTYLLYCVAGESGLAIAELEPPGPSAGDAKPAHSRCPERWLADLRKRLADPGSQRLRQTSVTMAATLASFGSELVIEHAARLSASVLVLAVALTLSMGRVSSRPEHRTGSSRLLAVVALPLVAVGASEVGTWMLQHPDLGDALFVFAVSLTIWARRFGALVSRLASLATLPLISMLVVPAPLMTTPGSPGSPGNQRWWAALIAIVALAWVTAAQLTATRTGLLPRQRGAPPAPKGRGADRTQERGAEGDRATREGGAFRRPGGARPALPASTRMAVQMAAALAAAFAVGRSLFPDHWTWVVLTAFVVCSGNRGRGDVVHKAIMRLLGASFGTLAATAVTGVLPVGNRWSVVAIFLVLSVALWLRPLNYAYWAAGMTAALALLYGYYGQRGPGLLADRLEAIMIGAALGIAASWFLLPVRTTNVIRRDAARALAALAGYVGAAGTDPARLAGHQAGFRQAVDRLERHGATLRLATWLMPPRWQTGPVAYVPAIEALRRSAAVLPALTRDLSGTEGSGGGPGTVQPLDADIRALRRGIGANIPPDPAAWGRLAQAVADLPAALGRPVPPAAELPGPAAASAGSSRPARVPRDRLWSPTERILGYVNRVHGISYQLSSRLGGSDPSCVYLLDGPDGSRAVLKWNRDPATAQQLQRAAPLIAAARAAGWAAPAWLASGTTPSGYPYQVQEHAPGVPAEHVTTRLVHAVLPVIDRQAGLAPAAGRDWSADDRRIVFGAGPGGTATQEAAADDEPGPAGAVAAFSPGGAALVAAIRARTDPFLSAAWPAGDLVHGQLIPANIVLDGGQLTALTGAAELGMGSRLHDVASLAVHALLWDGEPAAVDELLGYAASHAHPGEFEVSLAACLLAVLASHIARHPDDAARLVGRGAAALGRVASGEGRPGHRAESARMAW
jgi:hypothetical protein